MCYLRASVTIPGEQVLLLILILQVEKSWWWETKDSIAKDTGLQNNTGVGSTT